jgi:NAD(P)-dependent dehydrogenase (short-subunit alcohol dehydrogenase family)
MAKKVVLITAAPMGIGRATARSLLSQRGFAVYGTNCSPAEAEPLPGVELLHLDVRADGSVTTCVDQELRLRRNRMSETYVWHYRMDRFPARSDTGSSDIGGNDY